MFYIMNKRIVFDTLAEGFHMSYSSMRSSWLFQKSVFARYIVYRLFFRSTKKKRLHVTFTSVLFARHRKSVQTKCDYYCGVITVQFYVITGVAESRQLPGVGNSTRRVRWIAWCEGLFELSEMITRSFIALVPVPCGFVEIPPFDRRTIVCLGNPI